VDKLVKAYQKDGAEKWLLVHIEVQGYTDKTFPFRMFTYFYRICDKFGQPVTSIAIFTDNDAGYHPDRYEYASFGTSLGFRFNTYKVKSQDAALLAQSNNPFAIVMLTALISLQRTERPPEQLFKLSTELARRLFAKGFSKKTIGQLLDFIKHYVNFEHPELFLKFEEEIKVITGKINTMGIQEQLLEMAREKGLEEGKMSFVKNLLLETDFDIQKIARLAEESVDFVIEVKNMLSEQ
jgi:hypothetical protein